MLYCGCLTIQLSLWCGIHRWSRTKQKVFATLGFGCDLKIHHISHTMVCADVLVCLRMHITHTQLHNIINPLSPFGTGRHILRK